MADVEDVMNGLVVLCSAAVYPKGTGMASVAGVDIAVYPGWPVSSALDAALKEGKVHVSVFPLNMERNTTRFQRTWQQVSIAAPTLTLTISGNTITVGGSVPSPFAPQNMAVIVGGKGYVYPIQSTDTQRTIANALAALLLVDIPGTTSSNSVVTLGPTATGDIVARVGTVGTSAREVRRQKRMFQITVWAPTPALRRPVASAVDAALESEAFMTMPDGSAARVMYFDSPLTDALSKSRLYRRDLRYFVEYATLEEAQNATVVIGRVATQDPVSGVDINITDY